MGRTALALRWALSVDGLLQDLRFGVRFLRRRPLFALVSIGTLGLGIGSATAMFSVVNGTLLRPLTYDRPEQVVHVWQTIPAWLSVESLASRWDEVTVDWPGFERWREGQSSFSAVALYGHQVGNLTGIGDPRQITTGYGTASLLPLLGLQPARGRWSRRGRRGWTRSRSR